MGPEETDALRRAQREYVARGYPGIVSGPRRDGESAGRYFYQRGCIVVRDEYLEPARQRLQALGVRAGDEVVTSRDGQRRVAVPAEQAVVAGLHLVRIAAGDGGGTGDAAGDVEPEVVRSLRDGFSYQVGRAGGGATSTYLDGLGAGAVSVNHLVHLTMGEAGCCPATEPETVPQGTPRWPAPDPDPRAGAGVRVVVIDTALPESPMRHPGWLAGVGGTAPGPCPSDGGVPQLPGPAESRYAGHGTFVAGVVRTVAPGAEVFVRALFDTCGAALETDLVRQLVKVLEEDEPDIINLSAGTYTFGGNGLLALEAFHEAMLRHRKGVVLVAAAGNDGDRAPFWPAAAPFAVSVGALRRELDRPAEFSNRGGWVDVYAPGEGIVNAYPPGPYTYRETPGKVGREVAFGDDWLACWSGTSFATPMASGMIAARMSRTGENGREAAAALIGAAREAALARTAAGGEPGLGAFLIPPGAP